MENLPHVPSGKQNLSAKRLISSKCLIFRRQMLIPPTQNICQASLPILKPMSLLLRVCLGSHHFTLFDNKDTAYQTIWRLAHSSLQSACPTLLFLCWVRVCSVASVMSNSLQPYELLPPRLLCPWDSPGKNTGLGGCAPSSGDLLTQGWNPCFLHLLLYRRRILYHWATQGSPTSSAIPI